MAFQLINLLLSIGQAFSASFSDYRSWNRSRNEKVATVFDKVADCLIGIASSLREGREPVMQWKELEGYLWEIETFIGKSFDESKTKELKEFLYRIQYWSEIPWTQIEF